MFVISDVISNRWWRDAWSSLACQRISLGAFRHPNHRPSEEASSPSIGVRSPVASGDNKDDQVPSSRRVGLTASQDRRMMSSAEREETTAYVGTYSVPPTTHMRASTCSSSSSTQI